MSEEQLAVEYVKAHKNRLVLEYAGIDLYPAEEYPTSIFMAGSPGAGKTETAKQLKATGPFPNAILHIDPDEMRAMLPGYSGKNAEQFQLAVSILVDTIYSSVLKFGQSVILDGTFSHYGKAKLNIERSLSRGRTVNIVYVYQNPIRAWEFILNRQKFEGRAVPKSSFISKYYSARATVNQLKREFGDQIRVDVVIKDLSGFDQEYYKSIDNIDTYVREPYPKEELESLI